MDISITNEGSCWHRRKWKIRWVGIRCPFCKKEGDFVKFKCLPSRQTTTMFVMQPTYLCFCCLLLLFLKHVGYLPFTCRISCILYNNLGYNE